jgi:hypothetical protein
VDYSLELIDGNRHIVPKNPEATVSPARMYMEQSGLFRGDEFLSKSILTLRLTGRGGYFTTLSVDYKAFDGRKIHAW